MNLMHRGVRHVWHFFAMPNGPSHRHYVVALLLASASLGLLMVADHSDAQITTTTATVEPTPMPTPTPTPVPCSYSYGKWSECTSYGYQVRTVSASPEGCSPTTAPAVTQKCTFVVPQTTPTIATITTATPTPTPVPVPTTTTSAITTNTSTITTRTANNTSTIGQQCAYAYTEWEACQTDGTQTRTLVFRTPSDCAENTPPVLRQNCTYNSSSTTSTGNTIQGVDGQTITESSIMGAVMPPFLFMEIQNGTKISGSTKIVGKVEGAFNVEYYLIPEGSNTSKYLGGAFRSGTNLWSFTFNSNNFPNGSFLLMAKIKNAYGAYESGRVKISIDNGLLAVATVPTPTVSVTEDTKTVDTDAINPNCADPERCRSDKDSDRDGLSDADEARYGTDLDKPDSDGDGYLDSDEVKGGFDPLKYSAGDKSDKIVFESPKEKGEVRSDVYQVKNVEVVVTGESNQTNPEQPGGSGQLKLTGTALPNSFVTIYLFSEPIILTVKTDADGNWSYELDKSIEDGEHQVYVAVTDNEGKITAKSDPLFFVKTAQAVTVIPSSQAAGVNGDVPSALESRTNRDVWFLVAILVAALAATLATIGLIKHRIHLAQSTGTGGSVGGSAQDENV